MGKLINGRVGAMVLWLALPLLVPACPSTDGVEDGGAAGEMASGSDDAGAAGASQTTAGLGGVAQGGVAQGGVAQGGVAQGGVAQGGVSGEGGWGEAGALTSCPGNLCGDGSIWAEGRKCRAEGLLCDEYPGDESCARMQCCSGRWVLGEACSGEGGGGGGQ